MYADDTTIYFIIESLITQLNVNKEITDETEKIEKIDT